MTNLSFFVKIEGQSHSNHRNPQGIYSVEVVEEKTTAHSAFAALQVAQNSVPFLAENPNNFTLKVFKEDGTEVIIPRPLMTTYEERGSFKGRSKNYPESLTLQ